MNRRWVIIALLLAVGMAYPTIVLIQTADRPVGSSKPAVSNPNIHKLDSEVLSAIVSAKRRKGKIESVIHNETVDPRLVDNASKRRIGRTRIERLVLKPVFDPLLADMKKRNAKRSAMPVIKVPGYNMNVVKEKEMERIFKYGYWSAFDRKFPNADGIMNFSLPGYSDDFSSAVVCFRHIWNGRAGYVSLVFLKNEGGAWRITREEGLVTY